MSELNALSSFSLTHIEGYYRFENGALTTDTTSGRTLTNNNSVANNPGVFGFGADFGASNTNKSLTNGTAIGNINSLSAITIAGWIKPASLAATTTFFSYADNGNNYIFLIGYESGQLTFYKISTSTGGHKRGPTFVFNPALNRWMHIAITSDLSTVYGYVNGVLIGSAAADTAGFGTPALTPGIQIGTDTISHGFLSGMADDVSLWSRQLTATEILQLASYPLEFGFIL